MLEEEEALTIVDVTSGNLTKLRQVIPWRGFYFGKKNALHWCAFGMASQFGQLYFQNSDILSRALDKVNCQFKGMCLASCS